MNRNLYLIAILFITAIGLQAQDTEVESWHFGAEISYQVEQSNDKLALKLIDSLFTKYPDYGFSSGYHSAIKCLKRNDESMKAKLIFLLGRERGILKILQPIDTITHPEIRDTLIKYYIEDQNLKNTDNGTNDKIVKLGLGHLFEEAKDEPFHIYSQRHKSGLIKIFNEIGYPTQQNVGLLASKKIFILMLHQDPKFMEEHQSTIQEYSTPEGYCYIVDKLRTAYDKPQLYGTQVWSDESENRGTFYPIEEPYMVDQRRMEIGLQPLKYYARDVGIDWNKEKCKYEKCN